MSTTLKVKGMSCGHCANSIERALNQINGVEDVQVDLKGGKVNFNYDESLLKLERITLAIEDAGYDVVA